MSAADVEGRRPRYVVVGAGAVGVALAAGLDDAGYAVVLVARGVTYDAIRANGLLYSRPSGSRRLEVPVVDGPDAVELGERDVLVLATKTQDAATTLAAWASRPVATDAGDLPAGTTIPVVTLQNGLEAERLAARFFATVVGGVTLVAARHTVAGEVHVANAPRTGQIILGAATPTPYAAAVARRTVDDLVAAGWLSQAVDDLPRWKAWKLLHNVTNAVELFAGEAEQVDALRTAVAAEAREVLTAAGHTFADPETELTYDRSLAAIGPGSGHVPGRQSTWQSFARGATSEVDYLNGEIVLTARLAGTSAPVNEAVQAVLGASAAAGEGPGTRHVDEVRLPQPIGAAR